MMVVMTIVGLKVKGGEIKNRYMGVWKWVSELVSIGERSCLISSSRCPRHMVIICQKFRVKESGYVLF